MKIVEQIDGYGTNGCITASFDVTVCDTTHSIFSVSNRAEVVLSCSDGRIIIPKFYVSNRKISGDTCTFHCLDGMVKSECIFDDTGINYDDDDNAKTFDILGAAVSQMGRSGWSYSGTNPTQLIPYMNKNDVHGRSCRSILDDIANGICGFWRCSGDTLIMRPFGELSMSAIQIPQHTKTNDMGTKTFTKFLMQDSENQYTYGNGETVIKIDTPYANPNLAGDVWNRINGYDYSAWSCEHGLSDIYIPVVSSLDFADGMSRNCNNVTMYPTANGLFISCANNQVTEDEWQYLSAIERKIETKQTSGEIVKVFVNLN